MNWVNSVLNGLPNFVEAHPFFTLMIVGAYVAAVGQLNAPTKNSATWYRMTFAVLNFFSLQFGRMFPKIENSPNFLDGVAKAVANGTAVVPPPSTPAAPNGGTK